MTKIIIELGSNYTRKDGTSCFESMLEKFKAEHPKAKRNDLIDMRSTAARSRKGFVYDLFYYDYSSLTAGKYNGNSYRRKYARYVEYAE